MAAPAATGHHVPCGKPCGGQTYWDRVDAAWVCYQCGWREYPLPVSAPTPRRFGYRHVEALLRVSDPRLPVGLTAKSADGRH